MIRIALFTLALTALPLSAAEVYKCTDSKGRLTFSQMPCGKDAEKATIEAHDPIGSVTTDSAQLNALKASNRHRDLVRDIAAENDLITRYQRQMDNELETLRRKKRMANNNLAGAQWEQSISAEMSAVVERYNAKIAAANARIERLEREKASLQADR